MCRCGAYKFPHRMMGGWCDGGIVVGETFEAQSWGDCRDCPLYEVREDEIACQVLDGLEPTRMCPALQDKIRYEGIKLYGIQRPPEKKGPLRFRR